MGETPNQDLVADLIDASKRFMSFVGEHSDSGEVVPHYTVEHERMRNAINAATNSAGAYGVVLEALAQVTAATNAYLPPDGIDAKECISRILAATDNPEIIAALNSVEQPK